MTENRRRFVNAFDAIKPASSDTEFVSGILERTKTMKAQEDGTKIYGAKMYNAPKEESHSRVFGIIGAIAGTAAVLTGAVFGIKWLNEHGSLKGPDVQGGAGYHDVGTAETTTDALLYSEPEDVVTTTALEHITDYYPSDTTFGVGNYNVSVTGYEFNTVLLRLYYTVTRKDGGAITETEAYGSVSWYGIDGEFMGIKHTLTVRDDTSASFVVDIILDEPTHSFEVPFISGEGEVCGSFVAKCDNSNYVFRLPCDVEGVDPHFSELFISQSEVIVKYKVTDNNLDIIVPSVRVYMKGGYQIGYADSSNDFYDSKKKVGYQFRGFNEPCDTSNIGKVYIGDVLVYEAPDIQYPAASETVELTQYPVTDANIYNGDRIKLDFSQRDVECIGWQYDGKILAVKLTGDVQAGNGILIRSKTDPRTLIGNTVDNGGGTYTVWALVDVPAGEAEDFELISTDTLRETGVPEVGYTLTLTGTEESYLLIDPVGVDMTEYYIYGVTLEKMTLSTFGVEMLLSSEENWSISDNVFNVEVVLGDEIIPINSFSQTTARDESSGLYYHTVVATPDNMFGVDLTAASKVSLNRFVTYNSDYDVMPMPEMQSAETTASGPSDSPSGLYEGEKALDILKQYAGEDYCFPLEVWKKEYIIYKPDEARFNIPAEEGEPILAVTGGIVIEINSRNVSGQSDGIYITIQASDGRKWRYSHLSDIYVSKGDTVTAGDRIAAVGATGLATGPLVCISFPDSEVIDPAVLP